MTAKPFIHACALALLLGSQAAVFAQEVASAAAVQTAPATSPHEVIRGITDRMMSIIDGGGEQLKSKPDAYYGEIRSVLEPTVSFGFIAKNVMANYWNSASEAQRKEFVEVFTRGMVETLGKGMANYSDLQIDTLPPQADVKEQKRVEVLQEIRGAEGVNRVSYTMAKHPSGEWKLVNVVLNGVNLGKSFRDQFAQAMRQHNNDIDKVIAGWTSSQS